MSKSQVLLGLCASVSINESFPVGSGYGIGELVTTYRANSFPYDRNYPSGHNAYLEDTSIEELRSKAKSKSVRLQELTVYTRNTPSGGQYQSESSRLDDGLVNVPGFYVGTTDFRSGSHTFIAGPFKSVDEAAASAKSDPGSVFDRNYVFHVTTSNKSEIVKNLMK